MVSLPLNATNETILAALHVWLTHLARSEYQQAYDFTYHPEGDDSTPESLREQIAFYGDQFGHTVRLPETDGVQPGHYVVRPNPEAQPAERLSDGRMIGSYESLVTAHHEADPSFLGEAVLRLPFGGEWSDVFATFAMGNDNGRIVFLLLSIYIH